MKHDGEAALALDDLLRAAPKMPEPYVLRAELAVTST